MKTIEQLKKELQELDDLYQQANIVLEEKYNELTIKLQPYNEKKKDLWDKKQKISREIDFWFQKNHGSHCEKGIDYICEKCYKDFKEWQKIKESK